MEATTFLKDIQQAFDKNQKIIQNELIGLDHNVYNWKEDADSWSILECVAHLNIYTKNYQTPIENAIQKVENTTFPTQYKSGWFGKISIQGVHPDNLKPQNTLKKYNPTHSEMDINTLDIYLQHQKKWSKLLKEAASVDISKNLVPVEFLKLIKLKIGDALAFVIFHEARHLQQALRAKRKQF